MTWTYNADSSLNRDKVRYYIGDTDTTDQLVSDEDIALALAVEGGAIRAAVGLLRSMAAKFSRNADKAVGDLRISYSQRSKAFAEQAAKLETRSAMLALPVVGGITDSGKQTLEQDTDRVTPTFLRGQFGHPDIGSTRSTGLAT